MKVKQYRNLGVKQRQLEVANQMGVSAGGAADAMRNAWSGTKRLGLRLQNPIGLFRTGPEQAKAMEAYNAKWNKGWQQDNERNNARQAYNSALRNEGIDYNTTTNTNMGAAGAGLNYGSYAAGGGALQGIRGAALGTKAVMAAKAAVPPTMIGLAGDTLTPGTGQVQQNVRMKPYNPAMGANVEYEEGYAPAGYTKPASLGRLRHVALMAKAAVVAATPTPPGSPGIAQGYALNSANGYFSQHPASPYRINSPVNSANEYGSPLKNGLMNFVLPLASGLFGLNPTVKPPQHAGIATGPGTGLDPRGAVEGMGLNQYGLAQP